MKNEPPKIWNINSISFQFNITVIWRCYKLNMFYEFVCIFFFLSLCLNGCNKITIVRYQTVSPKWLCPHSRTFYRSLMITLLYFTLIPVPFMLYDALYGFGLSCFFFSTLSTNSFRKKQPTWHDLTPHTHYSKFSNIYRPFSLISTFAWHFFSSLLSCHPGLRLSF